MNSIYLWSQLSWHLFGNSSGINQLSTCLIIYLKHRKKKINVGIKENHRQSIEQTSGEILLRCQTTSHTKGSLTSTFFKIVNFSFSKPKLPLISRSLHPWLVQNHHASCSSRLTASEKVTVKGLRGSSDKANEEKSAFDFFYWWNKNRALPFLKSLVQTSTSKKPQWEGGQDPLHPPPGYANAHSDARCLVVVSFRSLR